MKSQIKTKDLAYTALFAAIIFILTFTPIGFIQLGFIKGTIMHVPVIIGSILLGPKIGAVLGGMFGCASLISNTYTPALLSFAFSPLIPVPGSDRGSFLALFIAFAPRILVGVVPYYVYRLLTKLSKGKGTVAVLAITGVVGSMVNTLLVMHLIYFIFKDAYAAARDIALDTVYAAVLGVVFTNGVSEALAAAVVVAAVCQPLFAMRDRKAQRLS